ncbi:MAG TPA: ABC transporter substrate-binding protein, partial [Anaerolineales bacterium]|nr:ABC transporter substrate-binding protein [Anaerolineales bacterium]
MFDRGPRAEAARGGAGRWGAGLSLALLLTSACSAGTSPIPVATPSAAASSTRAHAPEIRLGLIGGLGDQNVWALFSGEQYSYNDYAVRANYWPRLYALSLPAQTFEPRLASGMPTPIRAEGPFQTASVTVRTDLHWTDGSAFTAQDVAFTVNAALQFELGFDWADLYDRHTLDHAEAVAADTVKFFFKEPPGVQGWQLGALQGPVAQAAYWAPKVAEAAA